MNFLNPVVETPVSPTSLSAAGTVHEAARQSTLASDRPAAYQAVLKGLTVTPVAPDGGPDCVGRFTGAVLAADSRGFLLSYPGDEEPMTSSLVVTLAGPDGTRSAGLEVESVRSRRGGTVELVCTAGGFADRLLSPESLTPAVQRDTLRYGLAHPVELLDQWAELGVLRPVTQDRVLLCPKCRSLPSFRMACRACGSARVGNDRLIHHFACAYVGPVAEFDGPKGTTCPKCRTTKLVVGTDFEYQDGPFRCCECFWGDAELCLVAQCLRCSYRYAAEQCCETHVKGYHVDRLDLLALRQAP